MIPLIKLAKIKLTPTVNWGFNNKNRMGHSSVAEHVLWIAYETPRNQTPGPHKNCSSNKTLIYSVTINFIAKSKGAN